MTIIPFKSTNEALINMLGGNVDFSVNFIGDSQQYLKDTGKGRVYMLGVTGTQSVLGAVPFGNQGFDKTLTYMNAPAHMVAPTTMPEEQFKEIRDIFVKVGRSAAVQDAYKADHCASLNQMPDSEIQPWFNASNARWKRVASTISLK